MRSVGLAFRPLLAPGKGFLLFPGLVWCIAARRCADWMDIGDPNSDSDCPQAERE